MESNDSKGIPGIYAATSRPINMKSVTQLSKRFKSKLKKKNCLACEQPLIKRIKNNGKFTGMCRTCLFFQ